MKYLHNPNKECFGYDKNAGECRVFTETLCAKKGKCTRFKLLRQYRQELASSKKRAMEKGYYLRSDVYEPIGR